MKFIKWLDKNIETIFQILYYLFVLGFITIILFGGKIYDFFYYLLNN